MRLTDMKSETVVAHGLTATLAGATPAKGNIVDLADAGAATFALAAGDITAAGDSGISFEIQESDTTADADFTAVADGDLIGLESALDAAAGGVIGYRGYKRYVRVVATGSNLTDAIVSGAWALQKLRYAPGGTVADAIAAT